MRKRIIGLYLLISVCFLALMCKIIEINTRMYSEASQRQQTKTIEIGSSRGKIYDRNLKLMTDRENRIVAAVTPLPQITEIKPLMSAVENLKEKAEEGKPFICEVGEEINTELARTFLIPVRYSDNTACHLVGYLDSTMQNGLSGIEKSYNSFLKKSGGTLSVSFGVDAKGRVLAGLDKKINDNNFSSKAGVVLTIDRDIQLIAEAALAESKIESGCAIVMHIDTGEILALASAPTYDRNNVAGFLSADNSPLVNKALQSYTVGSVFKPIVAACALENKLSEQTEYECTGEIKIADTVFRCYDGKAHGKETMKQALENSCNTYFINLIEKMDTDYLLAVCRSLGFESETEIAQSLSGAKGLLPTNEELKIRGERANFAFGQGRLLATPLQMLCAYHALASGNFIKPTVIRGFANKDGLVKTEMSTEPRKIFSDSTVLKMRELLSSVTENGNAQNAKSTVLSLAGKTGTAQSGIFKDGKEICRTWFGGFFPANNPHYIVIVQSENGESGNSDCAPVFRRICEGMVGGQLR